MNILEIKQGSFYRLTVNYTFDNILPIASMYDSNIPFPLSQHKFVQLHKGDLIYCVSDSVSAQGIRNTEPETFYYLFLLSKKGIVCYYRLNSSNPVSCFELATI